MSDDSEGFTFSWQDRGDDDHEFLRVIFPSILAPLYNGAGADYRKEIRAATENWTKITLIIQINGHEVPADGFIRKMRAVAEDAGAREVSRFLESSAEARRLEVIQERVSDLLERAERQLKKEFGDLLPDEGW